MAQFLQNKHTDARNSNNVNNTLNNLHFKKKRVKNIEHVNVEKLNRNISELNTTLKSI